MISRGGSVTGSFEKATVLSIRWFRQRDPASRILSKEVLPRGRPRKLKLSLRMSHEQVLASYWKTTRTISVSGIKNRGIRIPKKRYSCGNWAGATTRTKHIEYSSRRGRI